MNVLKTFLAPMYRNLTLSDIFWREIAWDKESRVEAEQESGQSMKEPGKDIFPVSNQVSVF